MERNNIVPLNDSNYPTWKLQMKMMLIKEDLFAIVTDDEQEPGRSTQGYKKFCARRDKALATIVLAVVPKLLYLLGEPDDPVEVWDTVNYKAPSNGRLGKTNFVCGRNCTQ